ncbi:MAG: PD40 domain-containing protein [Saprospirales bacterium]|nr:PD40 domain-containing protein [Saprospirales bacterium]
MKYKNKAPLRLAGFFFFIALWLAPACAPSFKRGFLAYARQDHAAARAVFETYRQHPQWAPAARFFLGKMQLSGTRDLPGLLALDADLQAADSLLRRLPQRSGRRLGRRYGVDTAALAGLREQVQRWAVASVRARGTLPALDSLLDGLPQPLPAIGPEVAAARTDIVNARLETADYDTMTAILRRHAAYVLPENYEHTRRMSEQLWPAFLEKYAPCALDRFARDHPLTFAGRDCWREEVRRLFCTGTLGDLLAFHTENHWTALEVVLLNEIARQAADSSELSALSPALLQRVQDLQRRTALRNRLQSGAAARDTAAALEEALHYVAGYAPRYSAYRLLEESLQFFLQRQRYHSAAQLLERARPFFPDTLPRGCHTNFDYQRRVRPWIDGKLPILRRPGAAVERRPLPALNTTAGEEFSPVVRADGLELFFAARGRPDNLAGADVFRAVRPTPDGDWPPAAPVAELSGPGQQIPLSLTADGRQLLLLVNGHLHLSRRDAGGAWSAPAPLPVGGIDIMGKGCLSADGQLLVLEGAYSAGTLTQAPDLDLFVSFRDPASGEWSRPAALGADINTDGQEAAPCLLPDNRTLYYTSTGYPGLGRSDIFVARRKGDDWTHWERPFNLGKERNDTLPHEGYGAVLDGGKRAYLSIDGDLWEIAERQE